MRTARPYPKLHEIHMPAPIASQPARHPAARDPLNANPLNDEPAPRMPPARTGRVAEVNAQAQRVVRAVVAPVAAPYARVQADLDARSDRLEASAQVFERTARDLSRAQARPQSGWWRFS